MSLLVVGRPLDIDDGEKTSGETFVIDEKQNVVLLCCLFVTSRRSVKEDDHKRIPFVSLGFVVLVE